MLLLFDQLEFRISNFGRFFCHPTFPVNEIARPTQVSNMRNAFWALSTLYFGKVETKSLDNKTQLLLVFARFDIEVLTLSHSLSFVLFFTPFIFGSTRSHPFYCTLFYFVLLLIKSGILFVHALPLANVLMRNQKKTYFVRMSWVQRPTTRLKLVLVLWIPFKLFP